MEKKKRRPLTLLDEAMALEGFMWLAVWGVGVGFFFEAVFTTLGPDMESPYDVILYATFGVWSIASFVLVLGTAGSLYTGAEWTKEVFTVPLPQWVTWIGVELAAQAFYFSGNFLVTACMAGVRDMPPLGQDPTTLCQWTQWSGAACLLFAVVLAVVGGMWVDRLFPMRLMGWARDLGGMVALVALALALWKI